MAALSCLWGKKFGEIALCHTVFEIQAFFVFSNFAKNLKIQNGRHFWWDKKFLKIRSATQQLSYGSKILSKSLYVARFSRHKHFCVLHF